MSLFLFLVLTSCNKEADELSNQDLIQDSQVTSRSVTVLKQKREIVKEIIGCYDGNAPILKAPFFQATYGNLSDLSILYTGKKGENTYVFPLVSREGIENSILITESDEVYFLEKDQFLSERSVQGTEISEFIDVINEHRNLIAPQLDMQELRSKMSDRSVTRLRRDVLQITESSSISNNGNAAATKGILPVCEAVILDMVPLYATFLGLGPGYDSQLLYDAIVACHPSGPGTYCVCPIPTCVEVELFRESVSKAGGPTVIDLNTTFTDCFGAPDPMGNYIDCSSAGSATFELTLYADQPTAGSRDPYSGIPGVNLDVGHTFVSLSTNYGGTNSNITFGFYPQEGSTVDLNSPVVPMDTYDDGGHEYSSSVTISLTCEQFNQAMIDAVAAASTNDYDLNNYNCTDFGIEVANNAGLNVTDTTSDWVDPFGTIHGSSSNPGDLGEDILLVGGTANTSGDDAPETDCP